jgi:hypothetical protein
LSYLSCDIIAANIGDAAAYEHKRLMIVNTQINSHWGKRIPGNIAAFIMTRAVYTYISRALVEPFTG